MPQGAKASSSCLVFIIIYIYLYCDMLGICRDVVTYNSCGLTGGSNGTSTDIV